MMLPSLFVAPSGNKGRGVFTSKAIPAGTIIEISPVLVFNVKERKSLEATKLFNYVFEWGDSHRSRALGLGYISLYNHDYSSNCEYEMDFDNNLIKLLSEFLEYRHYFSAPYNPQTNGLTERMNGTICRALAKVSYQSGQDWDSWIPSILLAYRTRTHSATKKSPFEL